MKWNKVKKIDYNEAKLCLLHCMPATGCASNTGRMIRNEESKIKGTGTGECSPDPG